MKKNLILFVFIVLMGHLSHLIAQTQTADRIFINGKVWTGEDPARTVQAFAVRGDKIIGVGSNTEIRKLAGPSTSIVNLAGRLVVPGFNDSHWHFNAQRGADLVDCGTIAELQKRLREFGAAHPESQWVTGRGWGYTDFPNRLPTKKYLDEIFPDRPVFIWERDGHMGLANSKALALAKLTASSPDPENGKLERDASGELTGELKESAVSLVTRLIPPPTAEDYYQSLKALTDKAASYGITSLQEASGGFAPAVMSAFQRILAEGELKVRFYASVRVQKNATEETLRPFIALRETYRGTLLKFGAAKGMLDGTVDGKTAAMIEPYVGGGTGIPMWTQEELNQAVALYDRAGFQIWLHAIGDKAIDMSFKAYENAARINGTTGRRHRIEHAEVPRLSDYARFKQHGVIASTQALFANPDATTLENYAVLLGPERASHANAFKLYDDAGAVQAFGSDHPVFSMQVLRGIYCAVTRQTPEGNPKQGWYPEHRISVAAALQHFTRDGAYASFDEAIKGTLSVGKLADFVILSEDILSLPPARILQTKVLLTVMGGRETYRDPLWK